MNKYLPYIIVILLVCSLGGNVFSYLRGEQLEEAMQVLTDDMEAKRKSNLGEIEMLKLQISSQESNIENLKGDIVELDAKIPDINSRSDEDKDAINRTTDADSLAGILTRRYR